MLSLRAPAGFSGLVGHLKPSCRKAHSQSSHTFRSVMWSGLRQMRQGSTPLIYTGGV